MKLSAVNTIIFEHIIMVLDWGFINNPYYLTSGINFDSKLF